MTTDWSVVAVAALAVALSSALSAAAPKVDIRVVPRSRPEEELKPVPFREPIPAVFGPFWNDLESLPCIHEARAMAVDDEAYTLDFCHLANVTITKKAKAPTQPSKEAVELLEKVEGTVARTAALEEPVGENNGKEGGPEIPKIIGIFRGWLMDPITLNYKYMLFDDGDICDVRGQRVSTTVELVTSSNQAAQTRVYGLKKTDECKFTAKLFAFVPEDQRKTRDGIHTTGVLDISDAADSLPGICGNMKCRTGEISSRVREVAKEIHRVQKMMTEGTFKASTLFTNMTLEASKSTLEASTTVLESSLELFHEIEEMQQSLSDLELGEEEQAAKEIEEMDAAEGSSEEQEDTDDAIEEVEVTAEG